MIADSFIRLYLVDKTEVDISLSEWSKGGGGDPGFGEPEHIFHLAKKKGYFAVSRDGQASGLNGGCGDIQYRVEGVVRSEVLSRKEVQMINDTFDPPCDHGNATSMPESTCTMGPDCLATLRESRQDQK